MLLLKLWNYIRGYIIIYVDGYFLEKFINICTHRQIFLWDIKRCKATSMTMKISIKGFKALRPIARKTKCRVRIFRKKGIPFIFNRYRRRKTFLVGAVLFVVIIYFLTSFIWEIELSGNKNLEPQVVIEKLSSMGVKPGVIKYTVNTDKIVNQMMRDIEELSWVSVSLKGTKIKIELAERIKAPELVDIDADCNIVASKDGMIKTLVVKNGIGLQKPGDIVVKDQLLISGSIPVKGEEGKVELVHAMGSVIARTWYEEDAEINLQVVEKVRTGKYIDNVYISFMVKKFNLISKEINFENYDKIEIKKRIKIGEDIIIPFEYIIERFYENKSIIKELDLDEAKKIAADKAKKSINKKIPEDAKIVNTHLKYIELDEGKFIARVTIECEEEIGLKKQIGGD